jgi:hypothetical protein
MEKIKNKTMFITTVIILVVIMTGFICSDQLLAETIPNLDGASLIEQAKALNGQDILYQGEVVGDIMPRQDHYWINVLNNGTAIGIWITAEQRDEIDLAGQYGIQGDEVKVLGLFSQACAEHGGDLDIHASSISIIRKGHVIPQQVSVTRMAIAAGLFILASCCLIMLVKRRLLRKNFKL